MVTQSLNLPKFSVINLLLHIPVIYMLSYCSSSSSSSIFRCNVSSFRPYISSNGVHFRLHLISPNSLVVSHTLKIFATTPGKVLHSVVRKWVYNTDQFHRLSVFPHFLAYAVVSMLNLIFFSKFTICSGTDASLRNFIFFGALFFFPIE